MKVAGLSGAPTAMFDPPITTSRLDLVPAAPALVLALFESAEAFEAAGGMAAAPGLRDMYLSPDVSPDWIEAIRRETVVDPWRHGFFVVNHLSRLAVGGAGFKGRADADGVVEIAYGLAPGYRGRGLATEVAEGLMTFARTEPAVRRFRAHTMPANPASHRVLEKCGFAYLGDVDDPDDGTVMRWERDAHQPDQRTVLFVYGTLRRDSEHPMHDLLASASSSLGVATMSGRMYHLGTYPGARPALAGHVVGEAYALTPGRAVELLRTLDDYEGVARPGRAPGEYLRRLVEVSLAAGVRRPAWAWILSNADPPHPPIPSGDFLRQAP